MTLPISTDYAPMEAAPAATLPRGAEWQYEPKWDGFRCLAFRDRKNIRWQSKSGKPLTRYFPELVAALSSVSASRFVLDGEIVIPVGRTLSFDQLLMRIHSAASRIVKLSQASPCLYIIFDLLVDDARKSIAGQPLSIRRQRLEQFTRTYLNENPMVRLSPATRDVSKARRWFQVGVGLDGVVAKRIDLSYQSGKRTGMQKIKRLRTAECVVGGFRYLANRRLVGSLLLGLYNESGQLDHVGFTSSIHEADRAALTRKLQALRKPPGFTGKAPGGPSRWSERSGEWEALAPKLVVEVGFDHFTGGRFRHRTKFLRWRPDKAPRQCTFEQVRRESEVSLSLLLP